MHHIPLALYTQALLAYPRRGTCTYHSLLRRDTRTYVPMYLELRRARLLIFSRATCYNVPQQSAQVEYGTDHVA